ncbi:YfkD family protein [Salipaludibacillus daqingensis]|uniref:YfkD family protein n=1 Tax=Salipaludibacillus daqingensis TaxID=3041001 RepID=UPI00247664C6|nr:YfkD family protein [Salipaludibacillus daqingensis]
MKKCLYSILILCFCVFFIPSTIFAEDNDKEKNEYQKIEIPESAMRIAKENTYPNPSQDLPKLQPSPLAEKLLQSTEVTIDNHDLLKMMNESTMRGSKLAIGMHASIYLGHWPLSYESEETVMNWDYEKINTNMVDNRSGQGNKKIQYNQQQQKQVKGGLTAEVPEKEMVRQMMLVAASEQTNLPLSFSTMIGFGTQPERTFSVAPNKMGYLNTFVPAVNEKGKLTYGEVFLEIRGDKPSLEVKNLTQQGIGAWIPVQDYVNFKMDTTEEPR